MLNPKTFFKHKLSLNFLYISLSQIVNYVFPFLTFPYLVRVLGLEGFGLYAFATSFVSYFQLIIDYGFNIIGVKKIVENIHDIKVKTEVYSSIFFARMLLTLGSLVVFVVIVNTFSEFKSNLNLYIFSFFTVFSQVLIPFWFFQAVEEMKFISIINTISKIISTVLIFVLIKSPDNVAAIPLIYTLATVIVGIISYVIISNKFKVIIDFKYLNFNTIKQYLKEGWYFFISNISISVYTNSLTFLLGIFGTNAQVSYFSIPNKLVGIIRMAFEPVTQTLFPHFSNLMVSGEKKLLYHKIRKVFSIGLLCISAICLGIFLFAPFLLKTLFKVNETETVTNLRIQIWLPLILWFHVIFGFFHIVLHKMNKLYGRIVLCSSIFSIPVSFYLIKFYKDMGASVTLLLVELCIGATYVYFYKKTKKVTYAE